LTITRCSVLQVQSHYKPTEGRTDRRSCGA